MNNFEGRSDSGEEVSDSRTHTHKNYTENASYLRDPDRVALGQADVEGGDARGDGDHEDAGNEKTRHGGEGNETRPIGRRRNR